MCHLVIGGLENVGGRFDTLVGGVVRFRRVAVYH